MRWGAIAFVLVGVCTHAATISRHGAKASGFGIIDVLMGVPFGLLIGRALVRLVEPNLPRIFRRARGSFWRVRFGSSTGAEYGLSALGVLSCIVPGVAAGLLHSAMPLDWPWFGSPRPGHGLGFALGAGSTGMISMMLYVLISYARWYDSLPD